MSKLAAGYLGVCGRKELLVLLFVVVCALESMRGLALGTEKFLAFTRQDGVHSLQFPSTRCASSFLRHF